MLSSPDDLISDVSSLINLRQKAGAPRPLIVWEPLPSSCAPENREAFFRAVRLVDLFSPNHVELASIFRSVSPDSADHTALEQYARLFSEAGIGESKTGAVVIRAAEYGCCVVSRDQVPKWMPAYYECSNEALPSKVVDPIGAGNAFLGAFAIGYLDTGDLFQATCYGQVGGSFALEQISVPKMETLNTKQEVWNNSNVYARLRDYKSRLESTGC